MALRCYARIALIFGRMGCSKPRLRSKRAGLLFMFRAHDSAEQRRGHNFKRKAETHAGAGELIVLVRRRERKIASVVRCGRDQAE